VSQTFSEARDEERNLVPAGSPMDNIVLRLRNEDGTVEDCYPVRMFLFVRRVVPGSNQDDHARAVGFYEQADPSNNFYAIRDRENNVLAHVKRTGKGAPWRLIQTTTDPFDSSTA